MACVFHSLKTNNIRKYIIIQCGLLMNIKQQLKEEIRHYQDSEPEKSTRIKEIVDYIEELEEDLHKERIHRINDVQNLQIELSVYKNKVKEAINVLNGNKEKLNESKGS